MEFTRAALIAALREAVTDPRASARRMMLLQLGGQSLRLAVIAAALVSVLVLYFGQGVAAMMSGGKRGGLQGMPAPIPMAMIQIAVMAATAAAMHLIGRKFGGRGRFDQALVLVIWLQLVLIALQLVQLAVLLLLPPLADLMSIAAVVLFFWLLTGFTAELHGFRSMGGVFIGIIVSFFGLSLVLAIFLSILVGAPQGAG